MILVFDTSTNRLSIGISGENGEILQFFHAEASERERGIHDTRLAREAEKLLKYAENKGFKAKISRIGLIIGPGSFTGLRIGLSFAKGLAFASNSAIVPLTQHEVLQFANPGHDGYIVTPGYRPDIFYLAESGNLNEIQLLSGEEMAKLPSKPIIALDKMSETEEIFSFSEFEAPKFAPISLSAMARMTADYESPLSGNRIDAMEPLYLTEFKSG